MSLLLNENLSKMPNIVATDEQMIKKIEKPKLYALISNIPKIYTFQKAIQKILIMV